MEIRALALHVLGKTSIKLAFVHKGTSIEYLRSNSLYENLPKRGLSFHTNKLKNVDIRNVKTYAENRDDIEEMYPKWQKTKAKEKLDTFEERKIYKF